MVQTLIAILRGFNENGGGKQAKRDNKGRRSAGWARLTGVEAELMTEKGKEVRQAETRSID